MKTNSVLVSTISLSGVLLVIIGVLVFAARFGRKNAVVGGVELNSDVGFALIIGGLLLFGSSFILSSFLRK